MSDTITYTGRLVDVGGCSVCGVHWAIPEDFMRQRRNDHKTFWCPNGHAQCYRGKSEAEELKDTLAFVRSQRDQAEAKAEHNEHRRRAEKAAKTRLQKRIASGVCPCCNRTFENLANHIATKHPEFAKAER